jgi:hypothetical protein
MHHAKVAVSERHQTGQFISIDYELRLQFIARHSIAHGGQGWRFDGDT